MGTTQSKKGVINVLFLVTHKVILTSKRKPFQLLPYAVEYTAVWIDSDVHVRNNDVMKMPSFLVLK